MQRIFHDLLIYKIFVFLIFVLNFQIFYEILLDSLLRNYRNKASPQPGPEVAQPHRHEQALLTRRLTFEESPTVLNKKKAKPGLPIIIRFDTFMGK